MLYLDYAATTPVAPEVFRAMEPYFCKIFANPSSKHTCGKLATKAVKDSRELLAALIGAQPDEIIFTSGASEANNLAIKGTAESLDEPAHFITSAFEHKAALNAMKDLQQWGHSLTIVKPRKDGVIHPEDVAKAIRPDTVLCSIMHVNNEIGTIQPIDDIGDICQARNVKFHTDATQSFGKMPVRAQSNIDMISISAHKFYGPKGIGALYCKKNNSIKCQISGGSQEGGLRAGTTNVPGIVGMAAAAKFSISNMKKEWDRLSELEKSFVDLIRNEIPMAYIQGNPEYKVPWITNVCFFRADADKIRNELGEREICVSKSSACSKSGDPSHVLEAIGTPEALQSGAIRYSFGHPTKLSDVKLAAKETTCIVAGLRG